MQARYISSFSILFLIISLFNAYPTSAASRHGTDRLAVKPSSTSTPASNTATTTDSTAASSPSGTSSASSVPAAQASSSPASVFQDRQSSRNAGSRQPRPQRFPQPASTTISIYQQISQIDQLAATATTTATTTASAMASTTASTSAVIAATKPSATQVGLRSSSLWASLMGSGLSNGYGANPLPAAASASLTFGAFLSGLTGLILASGKVAFKTFM